MRFVVKYFSEIIVKSRPVRIQFSNLLLQNLRYRLKAIDPKVQLDKNWDRIVIESTLPESQYNAVFEILNTTPGVGQFLYVDSFALKSIEDICEQALPLFEDKINKKTFAVRVKRSGKHSFKSGDVERQVGAYFLANTDNGGVDLKAPEYTVKIEIRDNSVFAVRSQFKGLGGFPLGAMAPVLSLLSGGFDSTVASFETMRRGMPTHFLFFNLGGHAHEVGVKEVAYYLWQRFGVTTKSKFISVPFMDVVAEMLSSVPAHYRGVVLKRMMMRAASAIADKMQIDGLVTGEAIGQVASQTVPNLGLIDAVAETIVFRPLITTDKEEIVATSRRIGAFEFAESMPEYCGIISTKPVTAGKKHKVVEAEVEFDYAVLDEAISSAKTIAVSELDQLDDAAPDVEVLPVPIHGSVIIDIRHPDEIELKPLVMDTNEVLQIPFYKLHREAETLDKQKSYMLYCEKGVMSKLHAGHMRVENSFSVHVYMPTMRA